MSRYDEYVRGSILLVDDDEALASTFGAILREEGYRVDTATKGLQALDLAAKRVYDLAILDIKLPDVPGAEVARSLRERSAEVRIILITGYPDLAESIGALDFGIEEILVKPVDKAELLNSIRSALGEESLMEGVVA